MNLWDDIKLMVRVIALTTYSTAVLALCLSPIVLVGFLCWKLMSAKLSTLQ